MSSGWRQDYPAFTRIEVIPTKGWPMNEQLSKQIRVAWCSPMQLPQSLDPDHRLFDVLEITDQNVDYASFDMIVLDRRAFADVEALQRKYSVTDLPAVLILDTIEEEAAVLNWAQPGHETCRRDAIEQQLVLLMMRVSQYSQGRYLTKIDTLTGLSNRLAINEYAMTLQASIAQEESLCLIVLDIDRFKTINDTLGHQAGDYILADVARKLQQYARGAGVIGRLGGDEFVIVMKGSSEQGNALAECLGTQLAAHEFDINGQCIRISASFGVASASGHISFQDLLRQADVCMYAAKSQGSGRVATEDTVKDLADTAGQDALIADFENRIRVMTSRMAGELVLKARRLANEYRSEADQDGLTGIFNRRHLDRLLGREIEKCQKHDRKLTIVLLDLDHFGEVNRNYGFPTGDRALKAAAFALQKSVRALDWVARYGGEEFCVVMPETDLDQGCQIAERIRQAISEDTVAAYGGERFRVTASLGVVECGAQDADMIALFQRASNKVREAKNGGRNQVRS
jgi:two-component system, cell cycle response regulator